MSTPPEVPDLEAIKAEEHERARQLAKLEDREIRRGEQAHRLLNEPDSLLREVLDELDMRWNKAWRESGVTQTDEREKLYQLLLAKSEIAKELQNIADSGKLAEGARRLREESEPDGGSGGA